MIQWRKHFYLFPVLLLASFLASCQFEDDQECPGENDNVKANYINLTIAVSNGEARGTRAGEPLGGENGDGREAGFERENTVTGITLVLYKDATGINTSANPTLDFVRYFPVTLESRDTQGTDKSPKNDEARYTTGDQPIGKPNLDFSAKYHAIVIANQTLPSSIVEGTSRLKDLRDETTKIVYSGSPKDPADACANFVMTSEQDNTIDFSSVTVTSDAAGDKHYDLTGQALVIERMAARIDFHAAKSNGYKTSTDNPAYTIPGYEYDVTGSSDKFVVTGIVPFNLVNGNATYGSEYLFKRIRTDISDASTMSRLADETASTYVIDPKTMDKVTAGTPDLTSPLSDVYTLIGNISDLSKKQLENTADNPYYKSIESMQSSTTGKSTVDGKDNLVVCYPMENCLLPEKSKLYYHATGIAIIGYYYQNGTGTGTRYVYLSYLRHQGDAESYDVQPYTTPLATDATMDSTTPMLYGVVRNNIYRISINSVDKKGTLELKIMVKEWDPYTHDFIYM